jgi:bifunctional DNA-binding transcriptional regulator/antitoxin component of YhaV-PrlF toxin-antitoxin module
MEETVVLRPRRQVTLSRKVCDALGVKPGDRLALELAEGVLVLRPSSAVALESLRAIQQAFAESGITEEELLEGGRQVREEIFREKYGHLLERKGKSRRLRAHRDA